MSARTIPGNASKFRYWFVFRYRFRFLCVAIADAMHLNGGI